METCHQKITSRFLSVYHPLVSSLFLLQCCRHSLCAHFLSNLQALGADIFCKVQTLFMALLDEVA